MSLPTATITRDELSEDDLELDGYPYAIVDPDFSAGTVVWRRRLASDSPDVHGNTLISAVKETPRMTLTVAVFGDDHETIDANFSVLARAFEQFTYELEVEIDGWTRRWRCECADYFQGAAGSVDLRSLRGGWQVYTFQIRRDPMPLEGSH